MGDPAQEAAELYNLFVALRRDGDGLSLDEQWFLVGSILDRAERLYETCGDDDAALAVLEVIRPFAERMNA